MTSEPTSDPPPGVGERSYVPVSNLRVGWFFSLAYVASWAWWLPLVWWTPSETTRQSLLVAGTFGPSVAAAVLIVARRGWAGLRFELAEQWKWHLPFSFWVLILFAPALMVITAIFVAQGLGAPEGQWQDPSQLFLTLPVFLYVLILGGPLGEEFGWRGFALPHLEQRIHPTAAVVLLGLVWGLWHLPLFWVEGTIQQQTPLTAFLAQTTVTSVIYGWLWNATRSLPAVIAIHATTNTTVGLLPVLPEAAGSLIPLWTAISLAAGLALVLIVWTKGRLGYARTLRSNTVP